jgi:hypothetical protein
LWGRSTICTSLDVPGGWGTSTALPFHTRLRPGHRATLARKETYASLAGD